MENGRSFVSYQRNVAAMIVGCGAPLKSVAHVDGLERGSSIIFVLAICHRAKGVTG